MREEILSNSCTSSLMTSRTLFSYQVKDLIRFFFSSWHDAIGELPSIPWTLNLVCHLLLIRSWADIC